MPTLLEGFLTKNIGQREYVNVDNKRFLALNIFGYRVLGKDSYVEDNTTLNDESSKKTYLKRFLMFTGLMLEDLKAMKKGLICQPCRF